MKKKVLIGMSGGVDSSVAAYLLTRDYDVTGVTLLLHGNDDKDAKDVCQKLGIPHFSYNAEGEFQKYVIENFKSEYLSARTPNPCIMCNLHIKFGLMEKIAKERGFDFVATGHYSRLVSFEDELFPVRATFAEKDQTYALCRLSQKELSRALFPLGEISKNEVREIAEKLGLSVATKKDSQDICFIPDGDYAKYIEDREGVQPKGRFIGPKGEDLGEHKGLLHYTVGQRRGLGIAYSERIFVSRLDKEKNQVILGLEGSQCKTQITANAFSSVSEKPLPTEFSCLGKVRYNSPTSPCKVRFEEDKIIAEFEVPQRGVSPGQSLVLYDGERLIGGGFIE
ncbi:MAG: tRNA 2-thiouridine(34) synthase MnmA [Oscillospiraceae bacterium]|nr:tRNA 2-thiouridine(34) synthase MnmA [Oscillospiraceae bacterium]